jgi:hypothetical protein
MQKILIWSIYIVLATQLSRGADGWDLEVEDTAQSSDTPDRTGLSPDMIEFLEWAFENGLDFEVRKNLSISFPALRKLRTFIRIFC